MKYVLDESQNDDIVSQVWNDTWAGLIKFEWRSINCQLSYFYFCNYAYLNLRKVQRAQEVVSIGNEKFIKKMNIWKGNKPFVFLTVGLICVW